MAAFSQMTGAARVVADALNPRLTALEAGIPATDIPVIASQVAQLVVDDPALDAKQNQAAALDALAALSLAANKLPYADGPDSMALADLTAAARNVLSKSSNSLMLDALGIKTGSYAPTFSVATPGTFSVSYAIQIGAYARIMDWIIFQAALQFTPVYGTGAGAIRFGIPFPAAVGAGSGACIVTSMTSNFAFPAAATTLVGGIDPGQDFATLRAHKTGTPTAVLQTSDLTAAGTAINYAGFYKAAAA
jgi:hypothetical protein